MYINLTTQKLISSCIYRKTGKKNNIIEPINKKYFELNQKCYYYKIICSCLLTLLKF